MRLNDDWDVAVGMVPQRSRRLIVPTKGSARATASEVVAARSMLADRRIYVLQVQDPKKTRTGKHIFFFVYFGRRFASSASIFPT